MPSKSKTVKNSTKEKTKRSFADFFGFKRNKKSNDSNNSSKDECFNRQVSAPSSTSRKEGHHQDASHMSKTQSLDRNIFSSKKKKSKSLKIFKRKGKSFDMDSTIEREGKSEVIPVEIESNHLLERSPGVDSNETGIENENDNSLNMMTNERLKLDASKAIRSFDLDKMILRKQSTSKNTAAEVDSCGHNHSLPSFNKIDQNTKTIVLNSLMTKSPKVERKLSEQTSGRIQRQSTLDRACDGRRSNDNTRKYSLPLRRNITRKSPIVLKKYTDHSLLVKPRCDDVKNEKEEKSSCERSFDRCSKSSSDDSTDDVHSVIHHRTLTENNKKMKSTIDRLSQDLSAKVDVPDKTSNLKTELENCDPIEDKPVKCINSKENKTVSTETPEISFERDNERFECSIENIPVVIPLDLCSPSSDSECSSEEETSNHESTSESAPISPIDSAPPETVDAGTEIVNLGDNNTDCIESSKVNQLPITRTRKQFDINDLEIIVTIGMLGMVILLPQPAHDVETTLNR